MAEILRIARKEFRGFFASPAAWLFLGAFLAVTLFVFFWVETFFARNIADVRPLFQWMPVLLIFLVAALTMRAWSEERRSGTLESLLTAPVRPLHLVLGKFVAALALVALALALTLPLPITVSFLGPLDWGPVIGGYVAALFLAGAYVAIGLYMSSRTDNPIVALILTALVGGIFYVVGSDTLTNLFGHGIGSVLAQLGTGTRFESITRGVLDIRDLYYYLSIVGVFLALNLFRLERLRWWGNPGARRHRLQAWVTGLVVANFVAANLWLAPIGWARIDMTENNLYSLSDATQAQLDKLREPLVIKGYFSSKTHPLLAPLVPRIKDLLEEYAVAAGDRARVEFLDPQRNPELEEQAAAKYGIKPVPFQTASRYQSSVVNAYFNVVVSYGDQHETLGFRDLIEVKGGRAGDIEVMLKNPEYAITRTIQKTVHAYQAGGDPFDTLDRAVTFKGYMPPKEQLPEQLARLREDLETVLAELNKQAGDKFKTEFTNPAGDEALAKRLNKEFGFGPRITSLLDPQPFWFHMVLESGEQAVQVPLPEEFNKAALKRSLTSALQRLTPGFLKTVAVVKPAPAGGPMARRMGQPMGHSWSRLTETLREGMRVLETDLADGRVPAQADILLVLAPKQLDDKQRFAIDQFLMRGGSVVLATSPFDVTLTGGLSASRRQSGLSEWLAHHGLSIGESMVLDPQNAALPVPVERQVGGITFQEIRMMPYPHFPDVREDGLADKHPISAPLDQLTMNWASPITLESPKKMGADVTRLVQSSAQSWTSSKLDVMPDYQRYPDTGFPVSGQPAKHTLAVALEGEFQSFYQGKDSPLLDDGTDTESGKQADSGKEDQQMPITGVIEHSPESARLVLIASNTFATDSALDLASRGLETRYDRPVTFIQNAIDWSLEDPGLLALRGRSRLARTLAPLEPEQQRFWEYLNYGLALAGLLVVWLWRRRVAAKDRARYQRILAEV